MHNQQAPGRSIIAEGAAALLVLFPDESGWPAASVRVGATAHRLMNDNAPGHRDIGFFLYGVALAAGGRHHA